MDDEKITRIFSGIVLLVFGVGFVFVGVTTLSGSGTTVENVQTTTGQVVSTDIESSTDGVAGAVQYTPAVTFNYTVDDTEYESSFIKPGSAPTYGGQDEAEEFLADYDAGDEVEVYYESDDPAEGFLEKPEPNYLKWTVVGIGGLMSLVAVLLLLGVVPSGYFDE